MIAKFLKLIWEALEATFAKFFAAGGVILADVVLPIFIAALPLLFALKLRSDLTKAKNNKKRKEEP